MAVYAVTYDSKSSYITNGKRYRVERDNGRGLFNIRSNRGTMLTCLWEGCAHLGTRGNWTRIEEEEQVTLLPGDYVSTEGMTEDQYHAVARAFMAAGAAGGEYPNYSFADEAISCPRWSFGNRRGALFHGLSGCFDGRHLTPAQVIGAVNAGNQQEATMDNDFKLKCILHSAQKYLDEEREELERSDFHRVKAMQKRDRHDEMMQRARDMLSDGWMLVRGGAHWAKGEDMTDPANWLPGDMVECVCTYYHGYKMGKVYEVYTPLVGERIGVVGDSIGQREMRLARNFRFHHRPT